MYEEVHLKCINFYNYLVIIGDGKWEISGKSMADCLVKISTNFPPIRNQLIAFKFTIKPCKT